VSSGRLAEERFGAFVRCALFSVPCATLSVEGVSISVLCATISVLCAMISVGGKAFGCWVWGVLLVFVCVGGLSCYKRLLAAMLCIEIY